MAKKTDHKWTFDEQVFCIEYAVKNYKYKDFNLICENVAKHINETYDSKIIKFYPHLHQLMSDPFTGKVQIVGS